MNAIELRCWKGEIAALLATDPSLEVAEVYFKTDYLGYQWLETRYCYPDKWIQIERIGLHWDNSLGYAKRCKNEILAQIRRYIALKGDIAEGVITEVGGFPKADCETAADGYSPYSRGYWKGGCGL